MKAKLIGGPCHGEVVEFSGMYYSRNCSPHRLSPCEKWLEACYLWDQARPTPEIPYNYVGRFMGYFNKKSGLRVEDTNMNTKADEFRAHFLPLLKEIPNVLYAQAVCVPLADGLHIFFDISLADQYGKHSAESKNYTNSRRLNLECEAETLREAGQEMLDEMKELLR